LNQDNTSAVKLLKNLILGVRAYELLKESGFQLFCGESNIESFLLLEWKIIKHKIISVSIT